MNNYEAVIGLEVHNELKTESKVWCSCAAKFSDTPNVNCCPVCTGMPGSLPVLNQKAVEYTVKAGLALNCEINHYAQFDRKNYYYPDLSKAYQISQLTHPICLGGYLEIETEQGKKKIRLNRIHLEEDAGKLVHTSDGTLVDYNRAGVPLIEMVTEPDLNSADEALVFLETLKQVLKYIGISDCKMEEGSLRCDVNVSLHRPGTPYGTRTEMKNIASFKAAHRAIQYEIKRQEAILTEGGEITQETRRWDDNLGKSFTMRTKEDAQDYRYFPDPDLVPVRIDEDFVQRIRMEMPLLPKARAEQYMQAFGLSEYDAGVITADREIADFFDATVKVFPQAKMVGNWIMTEVLRKLKDSDAVSLPLDPKHFGKLLKMLSDGEINQNAAKTIFEFYWDQDPTPDPSELVERLGLAQVSDTAAIESIVREIIDRSPAAVNDYRSGNIKAVAYFVGQAMKATQGKANPAIVNQIVAKLLG